MSMDQIKKYSGWAVTVLGAVACFVFFQCHYPYHSFHREQVALFLYSEEFILNLLMQPGGASILGGEVLTQFFYFIGGGATVITLLLLLFAYLKTNYQNHNSHLLNFQKTHLLSLYYINIL